MKVDQFLSFSSSPYFTFRRKSGAGDGRRRVSVGYNDQNTPPLLDYEKLSSFSHELNKTPVFGISGGMRPTKEVQPESD